MTAAPLLDVRDLRVRFPAPRGAVTPVDGVSFSLRAGETVALVGESGSGKSLTARALLGLVPPPGALAPESRVMFDGAELAGLPEAALRAVRGGRIGLVFQDAQAALNPVLRVGEQVREAVRAHAPMPAEAARERAVGLLAEAGIPDPAARYHAFPHQLSGGLRQRAMIAIALAGNPALLVADEPTSALDVTVQAQILDLFDRLRAGRGLALLLITHDLAVVAGAADRVLVMQAGRIVEEAATPALFAAPRHPATRALLDAVPRLEAPVP